MAPHTGSIQPLPSKVAAQIESSTSITSLNGAILGLVKNSLDADAQTITITVDFQKGGCTVEDDGTGIPAFEFGEKGNLGKLHRKQYQTNSSSQDVSINALHADTSKFDCPQEVYGHKGIFLSSLISLALVTITSRIGSYSSTNSVTYHHSTAISRLCPAPAQHEFTSEHGTKVTVTDLFGNLPVRVKHRALTLQKDEGIDREWDELRRLLTGLLIASQRMVKLVLEEASKPRKLIVRGRKEKPGQPIQQPGSSRDEGIPDTSRIRSILSQVGYISPAESKSWVTASAQAPGISVRSAISLTASPTKQVQFISFGINPLNQQSNANIIYNEINRLFAASNFGLKETNTPGIAEELQNLNLKDIQQAKGPSAEITYETKTKGINRWPMFYVRIDLEGEDSIINEKSSSLSSEKSLEGILNVVVAMIHQFLEQYHFSRTRYQRREKRPREISKSTDKEANPGKRAKSCTAVISHSSEAESSLFVKEEFLNPKIRLPSCFGNRSTAPSCPRGDFTHWTRIKAGSSTDIEEQICSGLPRQKAISTTPLDQTPAESVMDEGSRPTSSLSAPMFMQPRVPSESPSCHAANAPLEEQTPCPTDMGVDTIQQSSKDNVIQWTNPVTMEILYINERTGLTLSSKGDKPIPFRSLNPTLRSPAATSPDESRVSAPTPWLDSVLETWKNTVFGLSERPIPSVKPVILSHLDHNDTRFFCKFPRSLNFENMMSSSFSSRLTKSGLARAQMIAQIDNKFLLLKMVEYPNDNTNPQEILVLVDQHAADERVHTERLFGDLCGSSPLCPVDTTSLPTPIRFRVSTEEARLFKSQYDYFASWGCCYSVSKADSSQHATVEVTALPALISERCRVEPKLAIDMLRSEIWGHKDGELICRPKHLSSATLEKPENPGDDSPHWPQAISHCPRGIVDMLNSRACRSAIMFNDVLSKTTPLKGLEGTREKKLHLRKRSKSGGRV
ncbi:predicted protein [Uncinocarpus reesii 1704]|uniref:MutL C-terminal dimerisation domain-containing protein n=1 Tax=Uncinocarpus reesii (strain UAMH 1704) TaxID=336963 RepID=C4JW58_UNCRE|nr:uncharacterized protein UREG_06800 [Uncinocarpus reesii 1704]EEP81935.1 predicted protein [Uncinocarpus reesii 1704]